MMIGVASWEDCAKPEVVSWSASAGIRGGWWPTAEVCDHFAIQFAIHPDDYSKQIGSSSRSLRSSATSTIWTHERKPERGPCPRPLNCDDESLLDVDKAIEAERTSKTLLFIQRQRGVSRSINEGERNHGKAQCLEPDPSM
jgi:hypothetical protein